MNPRDVEEALKNIRFANPGVYGDESVDDITAEKFEKIIKTMQHGALRGNNADAERILNLLKINIIDLNVGEISAMSTSRPQVFLTFLSLLNIFVDNKNKGITVQQILEILENKPNLGSIGALLIHNQREKVEIIESYFDFLEKLLNHHAIPPNELMRPLGGIVSILGQVFYFHEERIQRRFMNFLQLLIINGLDIEKVKKLFVPTFYNKTHNKLVSYFDKHPDHLYFLMKHDALPDYLYPWLKYLKPKIEEYIKILDRGEVWQACWDISFEEKPIHKLAKQPRVPAILAWLPFFKTSAGAGMFKRMHDKRELLLQEMDKEARVQQRSQISPIQTNVVPAVDAPPPTYCSIDDTPSIEYSGNIYPKKVGDNWLPPNPAVEPNMQKGELIDFTDFNRVPEKPADTVLSEDMQLLMQIDTRPEIARLQKINVPSEEPQAPRNETEEKDKSTKKEPRMALRV